MLNSQLNQTPSSIVNKPSLFNPPQSPTFASLPWYASLSLPLSKEPQSIQLLVSQPSTPIFLK